MEDEVPGHQEEEISVMLVTLDYCMSRRMMLTVLISLLRCYRRT